MGNVWFFCCFDNLYWQETWPKEMKFDDKCSYMLFNYFCTSSSVGSDTNTRGATTWEATADVKIAGETVLVGETLCPLEGRLALPVQVGNPEPRGCWDGDTVWRMPRRQWRHHNCGAAVLVPRLVGTGDRRQGRRGRHWFHIINGLTATELWKIHQLDTPPGE